MRARPLRQPTENRLAPIVGPRPGRELDVSQAGPLTETEQAILDFEVKQWTYLGAKASQIRERFGVSLTAYYAVLNDLLDRPEALEHNPQLVNRLRRLRDRRRRARSRL